MSGLWRSPRGARARPRTWLLAAAMVWVAAPIVGLILVVLASMLSRIFDGGGEATFLAPGIASLAFAGFALVYSPMFSWIGLALGAPFAALLLRAGFGGAISFAVLGFAIGALCGEAIIALAGGTAIAFWALFFAGFGFCCALILRWSLFWLEPEIFTKH